MLGGILFAAATANLCCHTRVEHCNALSRTAQGKPRTQINKPTTPHPKTNYTNYRTRTAPKTDKHNTNTISRPTWLPWAAHHAIESAIQTNKHTRNHIYWYQYRLEFVIILRHEARCTRSHCFHEKTCCTLPGNPRSGPFEVKCGLSLSGTPTSLRGSAG